MLPCASGEVLGDVELERDFTEIPKGWLGRDDWHLLWRSPINFKEPVHLIEARSILGAVKHRARDSTVIIVTSPS